MFLQSSYTTEYLSETNLVLTQEDFGNKMTDLLMPIKSYLQDDQDLLAFSLARYCGGDTRIAFYAQWYLITTLLTLDSSDLKLKTREYLLKKNANSLQSLEEFGDKINYLADTLFVPMQLRVLESKSFSLAQDIMQKYPFMQKYLSSSFTGKILAHELRSRTFWLNQEMTLAEYQAMQSTRESYLYVAYPALISFLYSFNSPESVVNAKNIKWVLLEEILEIISGLHQTGRGFELERMMYYDTLSKSDRIMWLSLPIKEQRKLLMVNEAIQAQGKEYRRDLHRKGTNILDSLVLPDKYMNMLKDLLDWALSSNFVQE
jgi:hypothetical protein